MIKLKIKALSVNKVWAGRRFKTKDYKEYEKAVLAILPKMKIPDGGLKLKIEFGLSNKLADIDNGIKPFVDILQTKYKFNDRWIMKMGVTKKIIKKGEEYIKFSITKL